MEGLAAPLEVLVFFGLAARDTPLGLPLKDKHKEQVRGSVQWEGKLSSLPSTNRSVPTIEQFINIS